MEELDLLITRATAARTARDEKAQAFGEIVRRFQDLAWAYAYALLGDFHLAQDAAQEAFISTWRNLDQLRKPEAFPGWFKRIVLTQCSRMTRNKRVETTELGELADVGEGGCDPAMAFEQKERQRRVLAAIQSLPEHARLVTVLLYICAYGQTEIAAFHESLRGSSI